MSQTETRRIGLITGRETELPTAVMQAINGRQANLAAEIAQLGGARMDEPVPYAVLLDRMSHEIPYYRVYLKYAAIQGCAIINNPFTWAADDKFLGAAIVNQLGLPTPRTLVLPNKHIGKDAVAADFRNLKYPMDWQGIIDYVGIPAIFKNAASGGRQLACRVNSVDELIQRYDESDTLTMILQEIIETDEHIHCLVINQDQTLPLRYLPEDGRYHPNALDPDAPPIRQIITAAQTLTSVYSYDINMVEFVIRAGQLVVINCANPVPVIDTTLMSAAQFDWCVTQISDLAIARATAVSPQKIGLNLNIPPR